MKLLVVFFLVFSALDLSLTSYIMHLTRDNIESNPFAAFSYETGGTAGMALHKVVFTGLALLVAYVVFKMNRRTRLRWCPARFILRFGCLALGFTLTYSLLALAVYSPPRDGYDRPHPDHELQFGCPPAPGNDDFLDHGRRQKCQDDG